MKRLTAFIVVMLMVVNLICPVWVSAEADVYYVDQTDEIERILAELGELRAKSLSDENEYTRNGDDVEYRINELESELTDLGVEVLTQDEVAELMGESGNARVTVPDSTKNVKWYSANVTQLYNGDSYTVKKVYAQGLNGASTLCVVDATAQLFDKNDILINEDSQLGEELLSIYVQKLIGMSKVIGWTPYELLFNLEDTENAETVVSLTYTYITTVCFCFVCPSDADETEESCSYISTSVSFDGDIIAKTIKDGEQLKKYTEVKKTINATNYASSLKAAEWYVNSTTQPTTYSYARKAEFRDADEKAIFTVQFPTPSTFWEIG